jgi:RHS repeat-associated protein
MKWVVCAVWASSAFAQTPALSTVEAPYPALQTQVHMAGSTYGPGLVAYGSAATPLTLSGSNLGDSGVVWFTPYKNGAIDANASPVQASVTLWTPSQISLKVPAGAVSGLISVVSSGKSSNGLPFIVTPGTYSNSCPAGPPPNQLQITTSSLQNGEATVSYSAQLEATGGSNSYTWSLISGSLPSGLSLSSAGVISGTPVAASGPTSITVQVVDTSTPRQYSEATLSLQVVAQTASSATLYNFSIQTGVGAEGYDPVGNVTGYTDSVNGTWSFAYDTLNRLATGKGSQGQNPYPNYCWQYDSFGNRLSQTSSATPYAASNGGPYACPVGSGASSWALYTTSNTNRMDSTNFNTNQSQNYDAAGNITYDGLNSYLYDGEGRICAVQQFVAGTYAMTQYLYDAEGHRVAKGRISSFNCDTAANGFTATTVYVLGPDGEQMTEMTNSAGTWQWAHTNVYAPGLSATYDADPTGSTAGSLYFHLSDWLGTRRQQTDYAGNPMLNFISQPYGDGLTTISVSTSNVADATEHHFTGKERDQESGNDYFEARYFGSSMGRFLSPDPLPWISWQSGDKDDRARFEEYITNPQNFDLYAYVRNNPLIFTDPTGESIYAIFYTTGNTNNNPHGGDDEFKRAAETRAKEIAGSKDFDPKKDKVLVIGVNSKEDFKNAIKMINGMDKQYGKVAELSVFSHSGYDGPVFPGAVSASRMDRQFILTPDGGIDMKQLSALHVNWESNAWAGFFGCNTQTFAEAFKKTQGVQTSGFRGDGDFYRGPEGKWYQWGSWGSGPLYLKPK